MLTKNRNNSSFGQRVFEGIDNHLKKPDSDNFAGRKELSSLW